MDLPGGRQVAWIELGEPAGPVVVGVHGTPGSSRQMAFDEKTILDAGVRLVCPDRPGYGLSTYHSGRSLADWVEDVRALADHLTIERFAVVGVSGGGPHAAACACLLSDRVGAAGLVSGVGPLDRPGAEEGMLRFNQIMTRAARRAPALMLPLSAVITAAGRRWPERALDAFGRQLPPCDAEVLARPAVRAAFADNLRHASRTSGRAAVQDFALFAHQWGFRLEDITVPVHIWQGDLDRNVPLAHALLQAQLIPGAELHQCPGEGHMLFVDHLGEVLRVLTA